jgi:hypothetical protein
LYRVLEYWVLGFSGSLAGFPLGLQGIPFEAEGFPFETEGFPFAKFLFKFEKNCLKKGGFRVLLSRQGSCFVVQ